VADDGALQPAWLLQARPYGDTSLLVECFTRDRGRIGAIARGARGPRSRSRSALQPFTPLLVGLAGRGELHTLSRVEAEASLPLSGERVFYGWYVNELLLKLTLREDPHPELFPVLSRTYLALAGEAAETALRQFEYALLESLGFGLDWPSPAATPMRYDWAPQAGLHARMQGPYAGTTLAALREGAPLEAAAVREARQLFKRMLQHALGGRPLQTPQLLREMRQRGGSLEQG
jgi:DNA repair protein RecO (recombination protein O)